MKTLDEWSIGIERVACTNEDCPCPLDESVIVDDVWTGTLADLKRIIVEHREEWAA